MLLLQTKQAVCLSCTYCIVLHLSIYIALLTAWAFQKCSRLRYWYCVRVNTPKCYRQMQVKDLPKVLAWQLEWYSNLRHSGRKAPNLPPSHLAPCGCGGSVQLVLYYSVLYYLRSTILMVLSLFAWCSNTDCCATFLTWVSWLCSAYISPAMEDHFVHTWVSSSGMNIHDEFC